jgi:hypothetical protein
MNLIGLSGPFVVDQMSKLAPGAVRGFLSTTGRTHEALGPHLVSATVLRTKSVGNVKALSRPLRDNPLGT